MPTTEEILLRFMHDHYSDEQLAALLAHAEDGKLDYESCCCFIGIATANHALRMKLVGVTVQGGHYARALRLRGARRAEAAFAMLCNDSEIPHWARSERRRERLIPLIRLEMDRRERERTGFHHDEKGDGLERREEMLPVRVG